MKRNPALIFITVALAVPFVAGAWHLYSDYRSQRLDRELREAFIAQMKQKPSWRHILPDTASEVQEWSWADGFLPDYRYLLKARITEAEFRQIIARLGLTPHTPDRQYSEDSGWLGWDGREEAPWWDASDDLSSTFVTEGDDTWTFAKYENGYFYFQSLNH